MRELFCRINMLHRCAQFVDFFLVSTKVIIWLIKCRLSFPRRRLVVITLIEHMGDIVSCTPVARFVREEEPASFIVWCVKKQYGEIVEANPNIDRVLKVYCLTTWILLRISGLFDRIVDLHIQGRTCPHCGIPLKKKEGDFGITFDNYLSYGSLLKSFSRSAGLQIGNVQPRLYIPERVSRNVDVLSLPEEYIVIHCHSNESCKDWSDTCWNELIARLNGLTKCMIIEIGSESYLQRNDSSLYRNICGKLSILEAAEVIRRARIFIGVDSGPAHISNAVGTFGVILIGKYLVFERYNPFTGGFADGSNSIFAQSSGQVVMLTVDEVINVVEQALLLCSKDSVYLC